MSLLIFFFWPTIKIYASVGQVRNFYDITIYENELQNILVDDVNN